MSHFPLDNNQPIRNPGGAAATFSTQGFVVLTGEYFQAQGTNGRSCASCHIPEEAWSINPGTLQRLFDETEGTHPVFNPLDAGPFVGTSHRPDKDVPLQPNMGLCVEIHPTNADVTKGVFIGDTFIITETGARSVNKLPPDLVVL